jgi:CheY-like chemotaxis protein
MISYVEEKEQFITLLAHANCSALSITLMQDLSGTLVLTDTQQEASTAITNKLFNLLIVDMDLNGLSLVSSAKTIGSINCQTPIIALIDQNDSEHRKSLITAGFDDYLLKPLSNDNVNELIRFWRENNEIAVYLESINTLLTIFRDNKSVVSTLYKKLLEELPKQVELIKVGLKTGQYQLALDAAHSVNGFAKVCHLKGFEDLTIALNECMDQKRYNLAEGYFSMLQNACNTMIHHRQMILNYLGE